MARKNTHVPSTSDAAVKAKTGHDWAAWFDLLDRAGAAQLKHKQITELLTGKHAVPNWWSQMVTVEYERARGLRARHEKADGFSVSVSKTVATTLGNLYETAANATKRKKWFPKGVFESSSQTKDKYLRGAWNKNARLEIGFYAKGLGKAQIALQVNKLRISPAWTPRAPPGRQPWRNCRPCSSSLQRTARQTALTRSSKPSRRIRK